MLSEQSLAIFQGLGERAKENAGAKSFALIILDSARALARRVYLHMPDVYPAGGSEPMKQNVSTERIIDRGEVLSADNIEEITALFPYFERIQSVRYKMRTAIGKKVPAEVLRTPNSPIEAGNYSSECVEAAEKLQGAGILAFLPLQPWEEAS